MAAVAGAIAGFALTALQQFSTVPLIRQAEVFEAKAATPAASERRSGDTASADEWPAAGLERLLYTALANIVGATFLYQCGGHELPVLGAARSVRRVHALADDYERKLTA